MIGADLRQIQGAVTMDCLILYNLSWGIPCGSGEQN